MPAPLTYNPKYHDPWAWSLAVKGATDQEVADAFGISKRTVMRWKKDHPSFDDALQAGKDAADARIEQSLYRRALGYDTEESEKIIEVNRDGGSKLARIRTTTKHVAPDTMAIMYWLNNRRRGEWSQRQEVNLSGEVHSVDLSGLSEDELRALAREAVKEDSE